MFISIIIATYNRGLDLRRILEQLLSHNYSGAVEIIVIDQTPRHDSETAGFLSSVRSKIRYFVQDHPNTVVAESKGLKEAKGEVVLFLDDDVEIADDLVARHAENYDDPKIAGVGGLVIQRGQRPVEQLHPLFNKPGIGYYFFSHGYSARIEVPSARGCNMSFRRSVLQAVGGFDTRYRTHQWELDLCRRIHREGWTIVHDPQARLVHLATVTGGSRGQVGDPLSMFTDFHLYINVHHCGSQARFLRWRLFRDRVVGAALREPVLLPILASRYWRAWREMRK